MRFRCCASREIANLNTFIANGPRTRWAITRKCPARWPARRTEPETPPATGRGWRREDPRHDGYDSRAVGGRADRTSEAGVDAGRGLGLAATPAAETFVRRLQRHAQHGFGCPCGRNALADKMRAGAR